MPSVPERTSWVGSHSDVPHAKRGLGLINVSWSCWWSRALTPMQAIVAGTLENARYFRASDRLGSIEPGKACGSGAG